MKVAVGSLNPIKIEAVKNIFTKIYPKITLEVFGKSVNSKVSTQPFNEKTIEGAINRAKKAMKDNDSDLSIGIEAGLFQFPFTISGYLDMHWCAILDKTGKTTIGCSSGFELPPKVIFRITHDCKEVGDLMDEFSGMVGIGRKEGAIGFLSKCRINRINLCEQAVLMAMIPRLNEEDYFDILR